MNNREVYLIGKIDVESINKIRERILDLWEVDQNKEITLFICSGGGKGIPAIGFYEWIKVKKIPLITVAIGEVSSAAIPIFLSGNSRKATSHSWFLMHSGESIKLGLERKLLKVVSPRRYREDIDWLGTWRRFEKEIIKKETRLPAQVIKAALAKTHLILDPQKAKEAGFIQEIIKV